MRRDESVGLTRRCSNGDARRAPRPIAHVKRDTRPLALYYFGHDKHEYRTLLERTHSGGVTVNDWGWHVINQDLPFGGIGTSGTGNYHGQEGFRELSHAKAVLEERRWFPIELFHPPYGKAIQRLALRLFLGRVANRLGG
ncbi:hypothetical protein WI40_05345 [Burkholderia ubonensis]|uniref:aldehyde dehydrogenase family protein n=1 Tax=Burkholderia ubonensis TaxID=101571 RepID=UPI0007533BD7|nr:aldehyde dehydrogenase family protein [Burkholderia ubonensis]KVA02575.1 hypothetical protein WI40_05345 [Burkholderia ubonensis]